MSARRQPSTTSLSKYANAHASESNNRSLDFCNSFWGFGDGGVDVLFARMRGATRTMEELKAFWKERASIEEEYAKRLAKLSKLTLGRDEIGDMRISLDVVRSETERQAGFHLTLAQQIRSEMEAPTTTFHARQLHHKKTFQAAVEKEFKTKQTKETYVNKAREKYEQDCIRINSFTAQASLVQGKDLEKVNLKLEGTQQTVQTNEREFANFAKALQEIVQKWEQDWKTFCDSSQDLEEQRLEFMKDNLWVYANAVSTVCVSDDESCEKVRVALEKMEPDKDMDNFVRDYGTGNQIPNPPAFVNYQAPDAIPSSAARATARTSQFARSSVREPMLRQNSLPVDDEVAVNTAGIGAGGGVKRMDTYNQGGEGLSRRHTNAGSISQPLLANGNSYPGSTPPVVVARTLTTRRQSAIPQIVQQQPLHRVQPDPFAETIDPTADTYIKVGNNAYRVDLTNDPQQHAGPSSSRQSQMSSSPTKPNGSIDPLMKQLEDLKNAVSSSGSVRRSALHKPNTSSTADQMKPGHLSTISTSSRSAGPTNAGPSLSAPSASPTPAGSPNRAPSPARDYRNSAEIVVGVHPSASRPASPGPPTAAFMVPKQGPPPSGPDVVQEVLADYQQSLPGEHKSISRSNSRGHTPNMNQSAAPPPNHGQNLNRPPSQLGHAGIGAHGSRSNSPQPASRGPSPAPSPSRTSFIQPPGPTVARAPSPNTVGIALDPSGRVLHDDMARHYEHPSTNEQQAPPTQRPPQQTVYSAPLSSQIPQQQAFQQSQRRNSYVTPQQMTPNVTPAPLAPQVYAVTPPPPNIYHTPSPQPNYIPPPPVQQVYNHPPPQIQYQPPPQIQHQQPQHQAPPPLHQQQNRYPQQQQQPPPQNNNYGSLNSLQRISSLSYYNNQTPPQQQPPQSIPKNYQQQQLMNYLDNSAGQEPSPQPPAQVTDDGSNVLFYVKALYDYTATIEEEFDFQTGDIIAVTATPEDGWWSGELLDENRRQRGRNVFPSNFVCLF